MDQYDAVVGPANHESRSRRVRKGSPMPTTLRWGLGIMWVGTALSAGLLILAASLAIGDGADDVMGAILLLGGLVLLQVVLLVFAGCGFGWARIGLAISIAINVVQAWASGSGLGLGHLATIAAFVLLVVPPTNAWYRDRRVSRPV